MGISYKTGDNSPSTSQDNLFLFSKKNIAFGVLLLMTFIYAKRRSNLTEIQYAARGGGGVLPTMDHRGRLRPKGVPFSGWRYIKGHGFQS